jgi:N-glycosidase YbiA
MQDALGQPVKTSVQRYFVFLRRLHQQRLKLFRATMPHNGRHPMQASVVAAFSWRGNDLTDPIYFYSRTDAFHEFSNFAPFGFVEDGVYWRTVEHYFQAQKFPGAENAVYREKIRTAKSPKEAKAMGQIRSVAIRPDWEEVKEDIMMEALRKKFAAAELRKLLLSTGDRPLVEASPFDHYWGCGRSGKGRNRLGVLLMQTRDELKA